MMNRPGAVEEERPSVPEGEIGKVRARSLPARTSSRNVPLAGCPLPATSRPNGGAHLPRSAAPIVKVAVDRERLSRRENVGENENARNHTIGRVSQDMFHAASGYAPVIQHSAPTYFHPRLTGRIARSSLYSELNPTRAWPSSQMKMSPICFRVRALPDRPDRPGPMADADAVAADADANVPRVSWPPRLQSASRNPNPNSTIS
jgi:hypothetical protein